MSTELVEAFQTYCERNSFPFVKFTERELLHLMELSYQYDNNAEYFDGEN